MKKFAIALAAAACLQGGAALAADFTLHVPVRLENLHNANRFYVNCSVTSDSGLVAQHNDMTGTPFSGAYHGTVTIQMNASDPSAARSATGYRCELAVTVLNAHTHSYQRMIVADYRGSAGTTPNPAYAAASGQSLIDVVGRVHGPLR